MIAPALYIGTGIALSGAIHQTVIAATRPSVRVAVHLMFALLCAAVAGFTLASAMVLTAPTAMLLSVGKGVIATGFLCWFALLWFVTVSLQPERLWIPLLLSVMWGALSLLNLAASTPLLYLDILPSAPSRLVYPANASALIHISQTWALVHTLILATCGYAVWCAAMLYRRGQHLPAASWLVGLSLLAATTLLDLATAAGWIAAAYISPLGWIALLSAFATPLLWIPTEMGSGRNDRGRSQRDAATTTAGEVATPVPAPALPHLPTIRHGVPAAFRWPSVLGTESHGDEQTVFVTPETFGRPNAEPVAGTDTHTETTPEPTATDEPIPGTSPPESELASIIQFTRIALRRIERGKDDPRKFAVLFRAILHKAEAARVTLTSTGDDQTIASTDYDVNTVVAEAIVQARTDFAGSDIPIIQKLSSTLPNVGVQRYVLMQVVHELIADALAATRASAAHKPVLVMTRSTHDGSVEVSVTDAGDEVSLREIHGAFEHLLESRQVNHTVSLIATARFIAAHGGQLRCTPNPAGGSIRHLYLPGR